LDHYARVFSEALGRKIRYRDAPTSEWNETLSAAALELLIDYGVERAREICEAEEEIMSNCRPPHR
jgi:hypothetical protein